MTHAEQVQSSDRLVADIIDNGKISGQQLLVVGLCMFFNMLDGFDITAMAVVAGDVAGELQLGSDKIGWIFSFALAGMVAGAMFVAPVADLIGRRRMIIFSVLLVGVSIILTANATSLAEFIVLRFLSGIGAGAMLASQATLAAEYSPEKYRALSVALVTSGYPLGAMFTSVAAGLLLPEYGWRGMFWAGGSATLGMGLVAWLFIPESLKFLITRRPAGALQKVNTVLARLKKPQLATLPGVHAGQPDYRSGLVATMTKLLAPRHIRLTLMLWLACFFAFTTLYFLMSWIPKLMVDAGYSEQTGRDAFFLFNLGGVVGIYAMGILSTRLKLTSVVGALMMSSAILMVVFAYAPPEKDVLLPLILAIGILLQGGFTGLYSVAAKAYPTHIRSTGVGWAIGLGRIGAVAGPAIAGYTILFGFDMSANFVLFAIPMALSAAISHRLHVR
ncbi:MAG TPA: MFS transporter [Woeseiaceae bacterium]|nr:MFS transporter [Woeseiaceae bacterium]